MGMLFSLTRKQSWGRDTIHNSTVKSKNKVNVGISKNLPWPRVLSLQSLLASQPVHVSFRSGALRDSSCQLLLT